MTTPSASVDFGRLVAADERDARADADDRNADQRDAHAAAQMNSLETNPIPIGAAPQLTEPAPRATGTSRPRTASRHSVTISWSRARRPMRRHGGGIRRPTSATSRRRVGTLRPWSGMDRRPILDDGDLAGVVVGAVSRWADAEAELKALARLRKFEDQYRLLAANSTNVVWELDRDGVLRWVSPSLESVLGWTTDRTDQHHASGPRSPDRSERAEDKGSADALSGRETPQFESRILTAEGSYRWTSIQVQPTLHADDSVSGVIVGLRDVHAEVVARHQVARSEQMFRLAMASAPQGMALVGLHLRFLEVNTVLCDMLGRDAAWFHTSTLTEVVHPDDLEADLAGRDKLLSGALEKLTYEHRWVRADGSAIWVTHSTGLVRDEEQMPLVLHLARPDHQPLAARAHSGAARQSPGLRRLWVRDRTRYRRHPGVIRRPCPRTAPTDPVKGRAAGKPAKRTSAPGRPWRTPGQC